MTDGNTYAIDEREDYDALQEVTAALEQAEARIVELEDTLSLRTNLHGEATYLIHKLEAKLAAKEKLMLALAGDKIDLVSELAGVKGKLAKAVEALEYIAETCHEYADEWHAVVCGSNARTTLAELSKERSDEKGQDDE